MPRSTCTCEKDLQTYCGLSQKWEGRSELKRIIHIRTQDIGLMPEIEDNRITDLATCQNLEVEGELR
ncbi:unnamed protein product, partial [Rotaria sp. Silwood2]